jgi:hypothetical protein
MVSNARAAPRHLAGDTVGGVLALGGGLTTGAYVDAGDATRADGASTDGSKDATEEDP